MNKYNRLAVATVEEVVSAVLANWDNRDAERHTLASGHQVGVTSLRMKTFARDYQNNKFFCVSCGCVPKFFSVDKFAHDKGNGPPHANLFGYNNEGNEVLFTHDHTLARSLGGEDSINNTKTMCSPCNNKKGKLEWRMKAEQKGFVKNQQLNKMLVTG